MIVKNIGQPSLKSSRIGDDVALLQSKSGLLIINSDMLVSETDITPKMSLKQAARKAIVMSVSDFAAKGVVPTAFLLSLGIPRSINSKDIRNIVSGIKDACREFSIQLIGGDTNESKSLVINCIMFGFDKKIISRDGATPDDIVAVTDYFGYSSAGLTILLNDLDACSTFNKTAVLSILNPKLKLQLGRAIGLADVASASMDSSDGLAITLYEIASRSGVGIDLDSLPVAPEVQEFADRHDLLVEDLVLHGGEEYEIVYTIPPSKFDEAQEIARSLECKLIPIGKAVIGKPSVRFVSGKNMKIIQKRGWTHLS